METTQPKLSPHAMAELRDMMHGGPVPRSAINPGVAGLLQRRGFVESVQITSPYPTHKGKSIEHLRITDAGMNVLICSAIGLCL